MFHHILKQIDLGYSIGLNGIKGESIQRYIH